MSLEDLKNLIQRWPDLLVVALVIGPIIWAILNATYRNRLEAMREDIDRLRARLGEGISDRSAAGKTNPIAPDATQRTNLRTDPSAESAALRPQNTHDSNDYPEYLRVPLIPVTQRSYLPSNAGKEIRSAMRALPPLARESAARSAYVGRWVRATGEVRAINERDRVISIFVHAEGDGDYFLDFPLAQRPLIESLREGQRISFEGQIRSVGDGHVSLIYPSLSASLDADGPEAPT